MHMICELQGGNARVGLNKEEGAEHEEKWKSEEGSKKLSIYEKI